jgi:hypothetical protein
VGNGMLQVGFEPGRDMAYHEVPGAVHNERSWAARLPAVLGFLFP